MRGLVTSHVAPPRGAVDVWTIQLDRPLPEYRALRTLLDGTERSRASRFVFERDRRHFVVCRGAVRALLAGYLGRAPEDIEFLYGARGKPMVHSINGRDAVQFNVAHSAGLALCAVASGAEVGVDVEWLGRTVEFAALASRFFSADESHELLALPRAVQPLAFFNGWTRKEAYIKAIGDGLSCPLDAFSVTLRPGDPVRMRSIGGDAAEASRWALRAFVPAEGYVAAVAMRAAIATLNLRLWPGIVEQVADARVEAVR
jgi:4'-phosphopantetheinyl transferase